MLAFVLGLLVWLAQLLARSPRLRRVFLALALRVRSSSRPHGYRRFLQPPAHSVRPTLAKPAWVRAEILRLQALLSTSGSCRAIAAIFNRRFAQARRTTVGKTFVAELVRRHRYDIEVLRKQMKNARPKPVPQNLVWALDLTGKVTLDGTTRFVLGILEHASRAALCLEALQGKRSWDLIRTLAQAICRYGKPRLVRTDNEAVYSSRVFRCALFLLGIRQQRTDPGCPWQNGRTERLFGTLKAKLDLLAVESLDALNRALREFRFFYHHVRPHQNLAGHTPAEAWAGINPYATEIKNESWFEAWDGLLCGCYPRR